MKLVGKINPVGESNTDSERFENLKLLCDLVEELLIGITDVANENKDRYESSMKRAGDYAQNFLTNRLGIKD